MAVVLNELLDASPGKDLEADEAEGLLIVTGPGIGREAVIIAAGLVLFLLPRGPLLALGALVPFYIVMKIDHDFEVFMASKGIIFLGTFSFL